MTDTIKRPARRTVAEGLDAELGEMHRRLAAAELRAVEAEQRAMKAVSAEDVAQFAFETAKRRADRFEVVLKQHLLEQVALPESVDAEAFVECLIDDIATGTELDDLGIDGRIESWTEEL